MTYIDALFNPTLEAYLKAHPHLLLDRRIQYDGELPEDLHRWYVYTKQYGHCILAGIKVYYDRYHDLAPEERANKAFYLFPVTEILRRGYSFSEEGYPLS